MYNPNYSLGVSLNTTTPKRRYNFDYNLDLMDQNQQLQNLSITAPNNYGNNFGNNYQGLDNYSLLNNQTTFKGSDVSNTVSNAKNAAGDAAGAASGMPWGTIGSIAGGVFNSLPDWYGIDHAGESKQAVKAIYGDSSEDPIARLIGGHGTDMANAKSEIYNNQVNYNNVKNNNALLNAWDSNDLQNGVDYDFGWSNVADNLTAFGKGASIGAQFGGVGALIGGAIGGISNIISQLGGSDRAEELNRAVERANKAQLNSFYTTAQNNQMRNQRQAMMNYFAQGGSLEDLNGVTTFNVGDTHEQNPYGGIQQGIASDGLPNTVEEGEVKYKDYIYSNRLKPSKTLIKDNNLPEKYAGLTYAEMAEKLQKESEDRPNDPISKQTLEDWMSRLQSAQETQKAQIEERKLAKALDSMSTEDKAILMNSLMQQQEGIDLGQPIYANGGKIYIKPENRGKFTATKKRTGKTTEELTHSKNPLTRKRAIFAQNARKWNHKGAYGLNLDIPPYTEYGPYYGLEVIEPEEKQPLKLNVTEIPTLNFLDIVASNQPSRTGAPWAESYAEETPITETPRAAAIRAAAHPETQDIAYEYWKSQQNPDLFKNVSYDESKQKKKDLATPPPQRKGINFNLENLRYAPAVGAGIGALVAALQPTDYTLANEYRNLASKLNPLAAPHIGGYRRYTPYDINLGDAENLALEAAALRASRGQNRATQAAQNIATINAFQKANVQRNLAAQQANEANRLAVDTYNLGIDQFNAQRDTQYDQLNQQILNNRLNMLAQAAQAADASRTARANMINTTGTNFFNQLGNVGQDEWNRNQSLMGLAMLDHADLIKVFGSETKAKQIEDYLIKQGLRKG